MTANHTNQIRVFLEKTDTLLDIKYDNSKGVTHELPPYFVENGPIEKMVIKLIYEDRRGRLKQGMSI